MISFARRFHLQIMFFVWHCSPGVPCLECTAWQRVEVKQPTNMGMNVRCKACFSQLGLLEHYGLGTYPGL